MKFTPAPLPGAFVIDIERHEDERGFFARTVCTEEFAHHGLNPNFLQHSVSWNPRQGTLRGMHYQAAPHEEEKLVRVTRGAVFDVIVDLRRDSPAFGRWFGVELSADNHRQLYIPRGVAHGFQTLQADTEVFYAMAEVFHPTAARGLRWDDAALDIAWPDCNNRTISDKDRALPLFSECFETTKTH
ncbi:dTDP-4-dehydrorhamnose 3,5-epimerase [Noviherbaspirillum cavernae]|uniref:dTDP-4-dehydrorhamnose 3,5-epimerase n=1 Tax=Noviherbaspirillum cavernae TaxID=2320862 RepID=UPI0018F6C6AB|nr:dTDP-4-dehydrorhamnose 3,5-epimerase [Noviherbaspirillum cavernae]